MSYNGGKDYEYEARNVITSSSSGLSVLNEEDDDEESGEEGDVMCALDMVNIMEKQKFMDGEKLVAVISGKTPPRPYTTSLHHIPTAYSLLSLQQHIPFYCHVMSFSFNHIRCSIEWY